MADDSDPREEGLQAQEQAGEQSPNDAASESESDKLGNGFTTGKQSSGLFSSGGFKIMNKKKAFLMSLGGGFLLVAMVAVVIVLFIEQFRQVNFDTLLRSVGFAGHQLQASRQFARVSFDAAITTPESTGRPTELGNRSLIQKLRGVNPEKQLKKLGRSGELKFTFEGTSTWGGISSKTALKNVVVNGKPIALNDFSKGRGYEDLSRRERMTARSQFTEAIRSELSKSLSLQDRTARSSTYNGLRQITGIRMTKWADKARQYAGKDIEESKKLNAGETTERVSGGKTASSSVPGVDDAVEGMKEGDGGKKAQEVRDKVSTNMERASTISLVVLGSTVACIVNDLDNSLSGGDAKEREIQMHRTAHDTLTAADQTKKGDTNLEAMNAENSRWINAEESYYYKQATGVKVVDEDEAQLAGMPGLKPVSGFAKGVHTLDTSIEMALGGGPISQLPPISSIQDKITNEACKVVLDPYVQYSIAGVEIIGVAAGSFFTAGGAAAGKVALQAAAVTGIRQSLKLAATVGVADFIGRLIQTQIDNYTAYTGAESGPQLYNNSAASMDVFAQTATRQINFGRPLSTEEATKVQTVALAEQKQLMNSESFTQRYFALTNPYSLAGQVVAHSPSGTSQSVASLSRTLSSVFMAPQTIFSNLFTATAGAQTNTAVTPAGIHVGATMWNWTDEEWNRIMTEQSFSSVSLDGATASPLENYYADHMNDMDGDTKFYEKYEACYKEPLQSDIPDYCTRDYLSTDLALHWRAYNSDFYAADCLSREDLCVESDGSTAGGSSEGSVAAGAEIVGDPFESSVDVACADGTKDVGIHDAYNNGDMKKMRMCAVLNLPCGNTECQQIGDGYAIVNSRVSGAMHAMVEAAKADGVNLQANSSFRTMAHQQSLCPCDGVSVARPGYSNHQSGTAIDFADAGNSKIPGASCQNRARGSGAAGYEWLFKNANKFGYKQYAAESWHWDPMDAANRC